VTSEYSSSGEGEEEESDRGQAPLRGGGLRPLTKSRRGGRGTSAWGGRGSARRQAVYERGGVHRRGAGARHGGIQEHCSGDVGHHHSVRRALEEEEAWLLHLEVSSRFSRRSDFEGLELKLLSPCSQGGADRP
jgi:hypothetical protein